MAIFEVEAFKDELLAVFGEGRINCLLYYGSHAFDRKRSDLSDYDFYLLLNSRSLDDLTKLQSLTAKYALVDITLQYLDDIERRGWHNFQLGNHGVFFMLHLASAVSLHGGNIFQRKVSALQYDMIVRSLIFQIEEYFWRLDHWSLSQDLTPDEIRHKFKKYFIRICMDMLLVYNDISFQEINQLNDRHFVDNFMRDKKYFTEDTKTLLSDFIDEEEISMDRISILRMKLYEDFGRLIDDKEYKCNV